MKSLVFLFILITATSCGQTTSQKKNETAQNPVQVPETKEHYKRAYFSSGCFWCTESIFQHVIGVKNVISGYSGGKGAHPTYENYAQKGYAETVEVTYDPTVIDFPTLLTVYFSSQNVTQQNGQGPDRGSGYRSIVFYQNMHQKKTIEQKIKKVQKQYRKTVAAQVVPFQKFWPAEAYHQNYEEKHPDNPYIRQVSLPRLFNFEQKHPELLKKNKTD